MAHTDVVATLDPFDWPDVEIADGETRLVWRDLTIRFPASAHDQHPAATASQFAMYLEAIQSHIKDELAQMREATPG
jgi:hypothetical protein